MEEKLTGTLQKWIVKADNDLRTVEIGLQAQELITDTICFHCQQAAEKYLKAFLISKNVVPEKTHEIERLLDECLEFDPEFEVLKEAVFLTEYTAELQYPGNFSMPSAGEANKAYQAALKVKKIVLAKLRYLINNKS